MTDSLLVLFRFGAPRPGRAEADEFSGAMVNHTEVDVGKARDMIA